MKTKLIVLAIALLGIFGSAEAQKKVKNDKNKDNTVVFYIARHGKTMLNTLDRVQGWSDTPLTPAGVEVAEYLGEGLKGIEFKAAYCSDLGRARQTARIVLDAKGDKDFPVTEMADFRETCFGHYEGDLNKTMWGEAGIYWQYPTLKEFFVQVRQHGVAKMLEAVKALDTLKMAEDYYEVRTRTQNALRKIAEKEAKNGGGNIFFVGHGMAISTMLSNITGEEVTRGHMGNASVCRVIYKDGNFTVETFGDLSFVEKGKKALNKQ